jgi:F-type H+-transporting ATPase subunit a
VNALVLAAGGAGFEPPGPADFWQPLFGTSGSFAITRPILVLALSLVAVLTWLLIGTRRLSVVPSRGQYVVETVYGLVRNSVARDIIGSHDFLKFVPLLFTMFVLILVNNLFGIIPFIQFPTMSRFGFPLGLALIVFVVYHAVGIRNMGLAGYFKHMVPPGLPTWIVPLIFFLELVTYFVTRPVTLSLRLFGNMFAGHILLLLCALGGHYLLFESGGAVGIVSGLAAYAGGVALTVFEGFVEFLQAYVFTLLTALYLAGSLAGDHH